MLTRATGKSTLANARAWLGEPLGIAIPAWPGDPQGIYFGGSNILWLEDLDYAPEPGETPPREKLSVTSFEEKLAEQMVVPTHLLNVKYASELDDGVTRPKILFPYGWTTRKR